MLDRRPGRTIALARWTPAGFVGRMFQTVATHVPTPSLLWSRGLSGTEEHVRRLLAPAITALRFTRRELVFRFRSAAEFVGVFRDYYGWLCTAFDALDQGGRQALYEELVALVAAHDGELGPSVAVPAEYLEAIAVVR